MSDGKKKNSKDATSKANGPAEDAEADHSLIRDKLLRLLEAAGITPEEFPAKFDSSGLGDSRSAEGWLAADSGMQERTRNAVAKFFAQNGLPDFQPYWLARTSTLEDVNKWCEQNSHRSKTRLIIPLRSHLRELKNPVPDLLRGTYYIYRYSFHGDQRHPRIVRDIMVVDKIPRDFYSLMICMHVFPDSGHSEWLEEGRVEVAKAAQTFEGLLYRFGNCFYGQASYSNGRGDDRLRTFLFPRIDAANPLAHIGIVSGYSVTLAEPVSVKAVAKKISHEPLWNASSDVRQIRRYTDLDHPDVARYTELIDNRIHANSSVLSVSWKHAGMGTLRLDTASELGLPPEMDEVAQSNQ